MLLFLAFISLLAASVAAQRPTPTITVPGLPFRDSRGVSAAIVNFDKGLVTYSLCAGASNARGRCYPELGTVENQFVYGPNTLEFSLYIATVTATLAATMRCRIDEPQQTVLCSASGSLSVDGTTSITTTVSAIPMSKLWAPVTVTAGGDRLPRDWSGYHEIQDAIPTSTAPPDNVAYRTAIPHALMTGLAVAAGGALIL